MPSHAALGRPGHLIKDPLKADGMEYTTVEEGPFSRAFCRDGGRSGENGQRPYIRPYSALSTKPVMHYISGHSLSLLQGGVPVNPRS